MRLDTVTVDKADHSQAWPWPELGGSAPVPLGQRLCLNSTERGESTRTLLSGGLWEDRSRINKGLTVNSTKTGLLLHWTERGLKRISSLLWYKPLTSFIYNFAYKMGFLRLLILWRRINMNLSERFKNELISCIKIQHITKKDFFYHLSTINIVN